MLGISYGELFLIMGAAAALIGPKDLPLMARTAGRLAGRAIGYVQMARGQFESVMQQSQARQVHKELQDTMSQLEAIRHEIRSISIINPGPITRRLVDNLDQPLNDNDVGISGISAPEIVDIEKKSTAILPKEQYVATSGACDMHSQANAFSKLAEESSSLRSNTNGVSIDDESNLAVLPLSAQSAGMLPNRQGDVKGSDIMLEAILEAEVAYKAKDFFAQPENQIKCEK